MPLLQTARLPPPTNEDEFEDVVMRVLQSRHRNVHVTRFGRTGQRQHGIDGWDGVNPNGLVWQATLQREHLLEKLYSDLASFDAGGFGRRSIFIFAVAIARDTSLQRAVEEVCVARLSSEKCPVEVLFWDDLRRHFSRELLRCHYPEFPIEDAPEPILRGLLSLGWDLFMNVSLIEQSAERWRFRLADPTDERFAETIAAFVDAFDSTGLSAWTSFSGLGTARTLMASPSLRSGELILPLGTRAPRSSVEAVGTDLALGDDGDIFPDLRTISGLPSAVQSISLAMSVRLGEWFLDRRIGTRCADFYRAHNDLSTLEALFKIELARLAFIPSGKDSVRLPFIERIIAIDIPTRDLVDGAVHATATIHFAEHGEWRGPLRIFIEKPLVERR
jgi:hypothetical protein